MVYAQRMMFFRIMFVLPLGSFHEIGSMACLFDGQNRSMFLLSRKVSRLPLAVQANHLQGNLVPSDESPRDLSDNRIVPLKSAPVKQRGFKTT